MYESPFENASGETAYFLTPHLEFTFESILEEISSGRLLSCVVGFSKAGKTAFLNRLSSLLREHTVTVSASTENSLSKNLSRQLSSQEGTASNFSRELQENMRVVLLIDDAHLLQDGDFAFLAGLFTLAKHKGRVLQVVLAGNGELIHKLARPDNRSIQALLGNIRNLPKLTRDQSFGYIQFLLNTAGLDSGLIPNPEPLVRRAAGVIGILRILTITLALKGLSGQRISDVETALDLTPTESGTPEEKQERVETEPEETGYSRLRPGRMLVLTTISVIVLAALIFFWLLSGSTSGSRQKSSISILEPHVAAGLELHMSVSGTIYLRTGTV